MYAIEFSSKLHLFCELVDTHKRLEQQSGAVTAVTCTVPNAIVSSIM